MSRPTFGRLTGMVHRCRWRSLYARVRIAGGPGSGKTYGGLQVAEGLRRPGGLIVLANCGEHQGEQHYAGLADFWHVNVADVEEQMAKGAGWRYRAEEGTDPRAIAATVEELAQNCPPGSVLVIDNLSDAWDSTKALADVIKDGKEARQGIAWQEAGGYWAGLMETIEAAPMHVIVCVRAKTEPEVVKGRDGYTFHAPTTLDFRGRDAHRHDLRFTIDSLHRVWSCEGRIDAFNQRPPQTLDVAFGRRLASYLATGQDPGNAAVDVASLPMPGPLFGPQDPAPGNAPIQDAPQAAQEARQGPATGSPKGRAAAEPSGPPQRPPLASVALAGEEVAEGQGQWLAEGLDALRRWARGVHQPIWDDEGDLAAAARWVQLPALRDALRAVQAENRGWDPGVIKLQDALAAVDDGHPLLEAMGDEPGPALWNGIKGALNELAEAEGGS